MATKKGPLQTKLKPRYVPLLVSEAEQLEVINEWRKEDHEKLLLLCDEMGIAEGPLRFYELALALARKHYAGFQQAEPLTKWTDLTRGYLVVEIERLTASTGNVKSAADALAKRPEWKSFLNRTRDGGEGLRVQYQRFKNHFWAAVSRDAFRLHVIQNNISEWESNLKDVLRNPHPSGCL